jgi:hypothetical protein
MPYDENSIRILDDAEILERMPWERVNSLAAMYKKPTKLVERLLLACHNVQYPVDLAVKKYFAGDKSIPMNSELQEAYRDLLRRKI